MKRIIFSLTVLSFFAVSYSARGEHSDGVSTPRQFREVPAVTPIERLNELINACSVGRPFPGLRFRQEEILPPVVTPPGDIATPPPAPPTDNVPPPSDNADVTRGQGVYETNCASCHSGGSSSFKSGATGVADRTAIPAGSEGHMPKGGGSLSDADRQALIAYVQSGK